MSVVSAADPRSMQAVGGFLFARLCEVIGQVSR